MAGTVLYTALNQGDIEKGLTGVTETRTQKWLSNDDLAERYGISLSTVRAWRATRTGPEGRRFGRHVRYALDDVVAWEDAAREDGHRSPAA